MINKAFLSNLVNIFLFIFLRFKSVPSGMKAVLFEHKKSLAFPNKGDMSLLLLTHHKPSEGEKLFPDPPILSSLTSFTGGLKNNVTLSLLRGKKLDSASIILLEIREIK